MARYHFNIRREGRLIVDDEGMEFEDIAGATEEAFASARELAAGALKENRPINGDQIEVTDSHGKLLFVAPVRAAAD